MSLFVTGVLTGALAVYLRDAWRELQALADTERADRLADIYPGADPATVVSVHGAHSPHAVHGSWRSGQWFGPMGGVS